MSYMKQAVFLATAIGCFGFTAFGGDWPMWRCDPGRTACSPDELPTELHLLWERTYTPRVPAWEDPLNQDLMPFDRVFEPIVLDGLLFIGFNDADKVVALDTATGQERWTFHTEGPVRLPPVAGKGKVYFACDDGYLYCLHAKRGTLIWKFRGGPSDRRVLGNSRLISMWPARGGPVLADDKVYFGAGIWPFMGIFLYCLDAETGKVVWENDGTGARYMLQPHNAPSFAGVAPQGAFAVDGDRLLVSSGRAVPACFSRSTGDFIYYFPAENNKTGGSFVCAADGLFFNHHREKVTSLYDAETGTVLVRTIGRIPVVTTDMYYFSGPAVTAVDAGRLRNNFESWVDSKVWEIPVDASGDLIRSGDRLYAAGSGRITGIDLGSGDGQPKIAWMKAVSGDVERLLAADGKLFAVTLEGSIMAFGAQKTKARQIKEWSISAEPSGDKARLALDLIEQTGVKEGYALFYNPGDDEGRLLEALVVKSDLRMIGIEPDPTKAALLKERINATGLYGHRAAIHQGDLLTFDAPPYLASLTVVNGAWDSAIPLTEILARLYHSMRPYGGKAVLLNMPESLRQAVCRSVDPFQGLKAEQRGNIVILSREGPLEGSASWTHNLGDIAQTGKSNDLLVRAPLGVLWFGGNSHDDVLPRHGHGPTEQVVGGRLFIQGINCLSARDVYTGRVIWKKPLHDLNTYGVYFDGTYRYTPTDIAYNQVHIPGANVRGTNYVATEDGVYVIQNGTCLVLDPATGETLNVISLPPKDPEARRPAPPPWGYIGVYGDLLIAGTGFVAFSDLLQPKRDEYPAWQPLDKAASQKLLIMDRRTGEIRWQKESVHGFLHNGIAAGNGTLFVLDKLHPSVEDQLARRGKTLPVASRLMAMDVETGASRWETSDNIFGSFLCYSEENDILLQSTRPSRDTVSGEAGERVIAYRGRDGKVLWDRQFPYATFPVLHGRQFITESGAFDLLTGDPILRPNPLTGENEPWTWKREYGCNYPIASEHFLTFRSGAAGYYDLTNDGGTGNFGGFKSGCTANLVAADGVLNAPDYTRTCSCSYQNQTSLALVHMPDVEIWTFNAFEAGTARVRRIGINLGAPGDRRAPDGTLWLDYPSVGGPSPDIPIRTEPEQPRWFCRHSSRITGEGLRWVAASGAEGIESITLTLAPDATEERTYVVRLHFAEPDEAAVGKREFDVKVQGQPVLTRFDIAAEAGGPRRPVMKEFTGVRVRDTLTIALTKSAPDSSQAPVLCGIEAAAEGW